MRIDWNLVIRLAGPIVGALFAWALMRASERRTKLITYYGHVAGFQLKDSPGGVHTHAVVIRNVGKKAATNVRVSHSYLPSFTIFPAVQHTVEDVPGSGQDIVLRLLIPKEQVTINYLYFPPVTYNQVTTSVKSDEGFAQVVNVLPVPQPPRWQRVTGALLMLVGLLTVLYVVVSLGMSTWGWLHR